MTIEIRFFHI